MRLIDWTLCVDHVAAEWGLCWLRLLLVLRELRVLDLLL